HHHLPFGGTLSLGTETYYRVLTDLAESLIVGGFRRIFILNGHGGNSELIQLVARDLALKHAAHLAGGGGAQAPATAGRRGRAGKSEPALLGPLPPELVREPRPHREAPAGVDP